MSVPFPTAQQPERPGDLPAGRPKLVESVSIAVELWVVVIVGQIIAFVGQYPMIRDYFADAVADLPKDTPQDQIDLLSASSTIIGVMVVVGVGITAVCIGVVLLTRSGYNAARIALGGISMYVAVSMVLAFFGDMASGWVMIPTVISGVAALGAAVMMMRGETYTYCREMARYRRDRKNPDQRNVPPIQPPVAGYPPYPPHPGPSYGEQQPNQTEGRNTGDQT